MGSLEPGESFHPLSIVEHYGVFSGRALQSVLSLPEGEGSQVSSLYWSCFLPFTLHWGLGRTGVGSP